MEKLKEETLPGRMARFEKVLAARCDGNQYFLGYKVTVAVRQLAINVYLKKSGTCAEYLLII